MRTAKVFGLMLVGVVVGVAISIASSVIQAQTSPQDQPASRVTGVSGNFILVDGNRWDASAAFLKDAKSGGCWLYITQGANVGANHTTNNSLAIAPASACR